MGVQIGSCFSALPGAHSWWAPVFLFIGKPDNPRRLKVAIYLNYPLVSSYQPAKPNGLTCSRVPKALPLGFASAYLDGFRVQVWIRCYIVGGRFLGVFIIGAKVARLARTETIPS
jgi:hypothetical protein